ncbi:P63C domain-containing protein [Nonomuraea sp. NPDC003727]
MNAINQPSIPPSPFAKHRGVLPLGRYEIECYVLDNGERVLALREVVRALTDTDSGNLDNYIGAQSLQPYLNSKAILNSAIEYHIPGTQFMGKGIRAESFLEICHAYVSALADNALSTERQNQVATRASILLSACAKVGLIALIDEATGYQYERAEDALQLKLRAYISEELREWEKTFPDQLWEEFGRLTRWQGPLHSRPKWWGKLVMELIYEALDPDVAKALKETKPNPRHGQNYHQWLTEHKGLKELITHINQVIGIAKTCDTIMELREKVAFHYGRQPLQLTIMSLPQQK